MNSISQAWQVGNGRKGSKAVTRNFWREIGQVEAWLVLVHLEVLLVEIAIDKACVAGDAAEVMSEQSVWVSCWRLPYSA